MTFSLVARCARTGQFGVAAVTAVPAVGKLLTHAAAGAGAVATQARVNPYLGIDGLNLLRQGLSAEAVHAALLTTDPAIRFRQFAVIDREGRTATFTGEACLDWCGSLQRDGFSAQGNRLAGAHVLTRTAERFEAMPDEALADRLLEALAEGVAAGGDAKGEVSATVYVMGTEDYPLWDIRVDHHPEPITELRRLHQVFREKVVPEIKTMPTRENPAGEEGEVPI
ncbi:DUF1028 domain-containing protein [Brevundimonas sp.]|uniref:DUF1028 domain-containing protein n=1 Tax=Brevundimonas sp. TaxID=1871086 RepID=UPI001DCE8242|nr:DUF1028 domain-containing protein [Brevundimonas sp.]MBA3999891.1 DUF1028 domain-containing protein [Brevundimonas sp.]